MQKTGSFSPLPFWEYLVQKIYSWFILRLKSQSILVFHKFTRCYFANIFTKFIPFPDGGEIKAESRVKRHFWASVPNQLFSERFVQLHKFRLTGRGGEQSLNMNNSLYICIVSLCQIYLLSTPKLIPIICKKNQFSGQKRCNFVDAFLKVNVGENAAYKWIYTLATGLLSIWAFESCNGNDPVKLWLDCHIDILESNLPGTFLQMNLCTVSALPNGGGFLASDNGWNVTL